MSSQTPITIAGCHRWQVYHRLCDLEIACSCSAYEPLTVEINSTIALIQLWSVMRQTMLPRQILVTWLEDCWRCKHYF